MKTLKEYIKDINISTTLHEASLLGDIEDTLATGNDVIKKYEKAEKDWKKLLKTRRFAHSFGDHYIIRITSPELAEYFGGGRLSYEKYKDHQLQVIIKFILSDAIAGHNYPRKFQLQIGSPRVGPIIASEIEYCGKNNNKFNELTKYSKDYSVTTKEGCNAILDIITSLKDMQTLEAAKELFINNIFYERN